MRSAHWRTAAVISAAVFVLAACDDADEQTSDGAEGTDTTEVEETTPEEPADGADDEPGTDDGADDEPEDAGEDDSASNGDTLSAEDISALLLEEGEFPVDFEQFDTFSDTEEGAAESMGTPEDLGLGDGAFGVNFGMWTNPESDMFDVHMIQVGIFDYETLPDDFDAEDLDFSNPEDMEDLGVEELEDYEMDMDSEEISHNGWEGVTVRTSIEVGGETVETETSTLTRVDGTTVLYVSTTGEGQEYLEEVADLQWEKYEAGR